MEKLENTAQQHLPRLRELFGSALQENVSLSGYTTARVGGPVQALLTVQTASELEHAVNHLWELGAPFIVLGSGSNVLVSDAGFPAVVILNRARRIQISVPPSEDSPPLTTTVPTVHHSPLTTHHSPLTAARMAAPLATHHHPAEH